MIEDSWVAELKAERTQGALLERVTFTVELANLRACQNWAFQKFYELGNLHYRVTSAVATGPIGGEHRLEMPG